MSVSAAELPTARKSPMPMGIAMFLTSESFLFGSLFWTYYYLRAYGSGWPYHHPSALMASFNTVILLASSAVIWAGGRAIRRGSEHGLRNALIGTAVLGAVFLGITFHEWWREDFRPWTDAYGSIFYTLTGFHALHVLGGVVLMLALLSRTVRHRYSAENHVAIEVASTYWHFVDAVWLVVFSTLFIVR
jgi:heme/copper-type cytochrome/quinol oxidase subunit 3